MNKKLEKKYAEYVKVLRELNFDEHDIALKIEEHDTLSGWTPITFNELKNMKPDELNSLLSYCWHDGEPRCDCIGITEVKFEKTENGKFNVEWSDENGDPHVYGIKLNQKINNIGDGSWNYGLFKKITS